MSRPASRISTPAAACSKATSRSTRVPAAIRYCSTPSSGSRVAPPHPKKPISSPAPHPAFTGSGTDGRAANVFHSRDREAGADNAVFEYPAAAVGDVALPDEAFENIGHSLGADLGHRGHVLVTIGLAAQFEQFYPVVLGTTLGMMLANIPAVLIGDRIADKLPVKGYPRHGRYRVRSTRRCNPRRRRQMRIVRSFCRCARRTKVHSLILSTSS